MMTEAADGMTCVAIVGTAHASRYLQQLCKHFAHKRPVSFDPGQGHINFVTGDCHLKAEGERLTMALMAPDAGQMAQLQDVVVRHLERFAFREELQIEWTSQ